MDSKGLLTGIIANYLCSFFFRSRRRHTIWTGDWSSDVCSSDLGLAHVGALAAGGAHNCATADDANGARALFCWGANGSSQLGNLGSTDAPVATLISSLQATGDRKSVV